jgi:hypothetical protein
MQYNQELENLISQYKSIKSEIEDHFNSNIPSKLIELENELREKESKIRSLESRLKKVNIEEFDILEEENFRFRNEKFKLEDENQKLKDQIKQLNIETEMMRIDRFGKDLENKDSLDFAFNVSHILSSCNYHEISQTWYFPKIIMTSTGINESILSTVKKRHQMKQKEMIPQILTAYFSRDNNDGISMELIDIKNIVNYFLLVHHIIPLNDSTADTNLLIRCLSDKYKKKKIKEIIRILNIKFNQKYKFK